MSRATTTVLFALLFILHASARADVTDFLILKDFNSIYYGDVLRFQAVDDGSKSISNYLWEWKAEEADDEDYVVFESADDQSDSTTQPYYDEVIGDITVRLTVTYPLTAGMTMAPPKTVIEKTYTVAPPDDVELLTGIDGPAKTLDTPIVLSIALSGGGRTLNLYATIESAQEQVTNVDSKETPDGQVLSYPLNVWVPADEQEVAGYWTWDSNYIEDWKKMVSDPTAPEYAIWEATPDDDWEAKVTQQVRVRLPKTDGTHPWFVMPSFTYQLYRVDSTHWKLKQ